MARLTIFRKYRVLANQIITMLLDIFLNFAEFVKNYVAALKETIANLQAQLEAANAGELLTRIAALETELATTKQALADALADDAADEEAIAAAQAEATAQAERANAAQVEAEVAQAEAARLAAELEAAKAEQEAQNNELIAKISELRAELQPSV
jgi:septal ring factor EnvC (AmiA/AmiB activator)